MSLNKTFISAISENDEKIINNFTDKTKIKKSKIVREFIRLLDGIDIDDFQLMIVDDHTFKILSLSNDFNDNGKKHILVDDVVFSTPKARGMQIMSDGNGNVIRTRKWGGTNNV